MTIDHPRKVRSFVRRPGRITTGQQRALKELMPRWGIGFTDHAVDLDEIFPRKQSRALDIGFGDGEALLTAAARFPDIDYLGVEVHEPGIGHLLTLIERAALKNVRLINRDAIDVIERMLPNESFEAVNLFFPDPWPKKRHHKRRIVQPLFIGQVLRILKPAGLFHLSTDWTNYAEHIEQMLGADPRFEKLNAETLLDEPLAYRAPTKFEQRGRKLGHDIVDFYYRKRPSADSAA
jgi:tRNA (guanine-N7-)-methyltransferase